MNTYNVEFRDRCTGILIMSIAIRARSSVGLISFAKVQAFGKGLEFNRLKHIIGISENKAWHDMEYLYNGSIIR